MTASSPVSLELPRPPGFLRRFWARHTLLFDVLVAVVYALASAVSLYVKVLAGPAAVPAPFVLAGVVLASAVTAALVVRRRLPWLLLGVSVAALANGLVGGISPDLVAVFVALYTVAVSRPSASAAIAWVVATAPIAGWALVAAPRPADPSAVITLSIVWGALFAVPTLVGVTIGGRRRYLDALVERARQLALERDQQAVIAAQAERARIAREMHDIVAHSLSVVVTLADGAAANVTRDPGEAERAMRLAAEAGRDAMGQMRRLLGVLREDGGADDAGRRPQPALLDLPALVETFRSAGLVVEVTGAGDQGRLDPGQQLVLYRVVQESLTNALRYAGAGALVGIGLTVGPTAVRLRILDDGAGRPSGGPAGAGRGLAGLRERVESMGGDLSAGPAGSGWSVDASLPMADRS